MVIRCHQHGAGGLMCGLATAKARATGGHMSDTGGGRFREDCAVRSNKSWVMVTWGPP